MSTPPLSPEDLARLLLAVEAERAPPSETHVAEAVRVCMKLREPLVKFAGVAGFSSLLSRAVALAKAKAPALAAVVVKEDGFLTGFEGAAQNQNPEAADDGAVALVARLLDLLVTFIGERLMLRLVRDAWPDLSTDGLDNGDETKP